MNRVRLVVTVDVEEDQWRSYGPERCPVENVQALPAVQELMDRFGATPTYLVSYPVSVDDRAVRTLRDLYGSGRCEIGAHCHAWNTPPFEEARTRENRLLCNLPPPLQRRKLEMLHESIHARIGVEPTSFRSGRWGYGESVVENLASLGYQVDSSVSPYIDWRPEHGPDFRQVSPRAYRFTAATPNGRGPGRELVEIPATIGFLQQNFERSGQLHAVLRSNPLNRLRIDGVLNRLGLLNRVWLSPEVASADEMIALARATVSNGYRILNLVFHSSSLIPGLTPFVKTPDDRARLLDGLGSFLGFCRDTGIEPVSLSEAARFV